jgi:peptide/nickel transport system substrate-binding protein
LDYYPLVDRAAVKYAFDVRRSEQLMTEAGFTKRDGFFTGANGARVNLEVRNIQSAQNDSERSIIADGWRKAGFEVEEDVFTPRQSQDGQVLGTFRSLSITSAAAVREGLKIDDYVSSNASRPETRWFGSNRGGWISPEYDQVINSWLTTLQPSQRHEQLARAVGIMTDDLGLIPLHFNPGVIAYATGITGPTFKSSDAEITWNIHEWEYR